MPITFDETSYLATIGWASNRFFSGAASTTLAYNGPEETLAMVQDLADRLEAAVAALLPEIDSNFSHDATRVESASFSIDSGGTGPGTYSSDVVTPPQVAALEVKSAAGKGPRNRGRNFWPNMFMERSQVGEDGIIATSRWETLSAALDAFHADVVDGSDFVLAIPQSDEPGQVTTPILPWPEVTSRELSTRVATQRRRVRR